MDTTTVAKDERRRKILREAVHRFNNELMGDEERMLLLDRIKRLRGATAGERAASGR